MLTNLVARSFSVVPFFMVNETVSMLSRVLSVYNRDRVRLFCFVLLLVCSHISVCTYSNAIPLMSMCFCSLFVDGGIRNKSKAAMQEHGVSQVGDDGIILRVEVR